MSFQTMAESMTDELFNVFGEVGATLDGVAVAVIVDRNVQVVTGGESQVFAGVTTGTFYADQATARGQVLALAGGETFRIGDEFEVDEHIKRVTLR